jgi:AcrR family transcriptional regulator
MAPRSNAVSSPRLTRDEIVDAALAHLEDGDLESLTVRKLAMDLRVSPMALYRHVSNKDDILLAVADALLARQRHRPPRDARAALTSVARALRTLLTQRPALLGVYNRQPVTTPAARQRLEDTVAVLVNLGWSRRRAVQAYAAVHTYTLGFCTLEAARDRAVRSPVVDGDRAATAIRGFVSSAQFKHGLEAMILGLVPDTPG